ncbi:hypothetical protein F4604DRAFT_1981278 [Suillus subluteus]|nr:hypothetical protein F4604DRAFT_1981278 [Suillus subluteus]
MDDRTALATVASLNDLDSAVFRTVKQIRITPVITRVSPALILFCKYPIGAWEAGGGSKGQSARKHASATISFPNDLPMTGPYAGPFPTRTLSPAVQVTGHISIGATSASLNVKSLGICCSCVVCLQLFRKPNLELSDHQNNRVLDHIWLNPNLDIIMTPPATFCLVFSALHLLLISRGFRTYNNYQFLSCTHDWHSEGLD